MKLIKKSRIRIILLGALLVLILTATTYLVFRPKKTAAPSDTNTSQKQTNQTSQSPDSSTIDPETSKPTFDKTAYSTSDPSSIWVVVNKKRPLNPTGFAPTDLLSVGGGQRLRQEAASALQTMFQAASEAGLALQPLSGYRSYATQQSVYNREVATYGQAVADTQSARPGYSEHQTGLAIDLGGGGCGIEDCFGNTAQGKWVASNGYKYGFIIRYQPGKESITGYRAEPWHIRYVGVALATEIQKNGQTLEEFFGLGAAPTY